MSQSHLWMNLLIFPVVITLKSFKQLLHLSRIKLLSLTGIFAIMCKRAQHSGTGVFVCFNWPSWDDETPVHAEFILNVKKNTFGWLKCFGVIWICECSVFLKEFSRNFDFHIFSSTFAVTMLVHSPEQVFLMYNKEKELCFAATCSYN